MQLGKVIPLFQRQKPRTVLHVLDTYWNALPMIDGVPARDDIDPRGLQGALDHIALIDHIGKGNAQIRVAGQKWDATFKSDLIGLPLSVLFASEARLQLAQIILDLIGLPSKVSFSIETAQHHGNGSDLGHITFYPLRDMTGQVSQGIGVLSPVGAVDSKTDKAIITRYQSQAVTDQKEGSALKP